MNQAEKIGHREGAPATTPAWALEFAFSLAAAVWRIPQAALQGRNRARRYARGWRLGLHLAHVGLGLSLTGASAGLARHRAAARRACALTEDSRDLAQWDRVLDGLERALRLWCKQISHEMAECVR
ncbi:MAG: hypothetical protein Q8M31_13785 [Beijerinckiaceae bacterium]|nr:hypothetical protein [Beijerinckiaceae bacterium]